jgi:hypothetical protein
MKSKLKKTVLSTAILAVSVPFLPGQKANALEIQSPTFIGEVKPTLLFRPRYEYVDEQNNNKNANALTTRVAVGAQIDKIFQVPNLSAYLEATYVGALIDDYSPQKAGYPTVSDPDITRITEAHVKYKFNKTSFIFGRIRINLDDQRFFSSADWRQMPQTFGIIGIQDNTVNNLNIFLAGIYERLAVTDTGNIDWKLDKMPIIFNASYKFAPQLKLTGYAYLLSAGIQQDGNKFKGGNTYGINATGEIQLSKDVKFSYLGEYAIQKDPYANDGLPKKPKIDANFYRAEVKLSGYGFFGTLGYERSQGSDKGEDAGFTTPFTTLHGFQGWADRFASYAYGDMRYGLKDAYATIGYTHKDYGTLSLTYHKFDADKNQGYNGTTPLPTLTSKNFGNEIDALYTVNLTKRLNFLAKAAWYNGKDSMPASLRNDLTKYWIQLTYRY